MSDTTSPIKGNYMAAWMVQEQLVNKDNVPPTQPAASSEDHREAWTKTFNDGINIDTNLKTFIDKGGFPTVAIGKNKSAEAMLAMNLFVPDLNGIRENMPVSPQVLEQMTNELKK